MTSPTPLNSILGNAKTHLLQVDTVEKVDIEPHGRSAWVGAAAPCVHLDADVESLRQIVDTIPGRPGEFSVRREISVLIQAWYPFSTRLDSETAWRTALDAILDKLERHMTLGLGLAYAGPPVVVTDDFKPRTSPNQGDIAVLCHYAQISFPVADHYVVVTR